MAQTIEEFDRSTLGPKTRVHALAKQLGMTSKELIVALDGLGLVKVAQSNLSLDEAVAESRGGGTSVPTPLVYRAPAGPGRHPLAWFPNNVARNSPATLSNFEIGPLQFQRL